VFIPNVAKMHQSVNLKNCSSATILSTPVAEFSTLPLAERVHQSYLTWEHYEMANNQSDFLLKILASDRTAT